MNKTIARLLTFWIPVKEWRRNLRSELTVNGALLEAFDQVAQTYYLFQRNKDKVETIFLGNSASLYGIHPDEYKKTQAINLALPAQDLYVSYNLYKNVCDQMPNLRRVFINYSIFSRNFILEKAVNSNWGIGQIIGYKNFFNIPFYFKKNEAVFNKKLKAAKNKVTSVFNEKFVRPVYFSKEEDCELRVIKEHLGYFKSGVGDGFNYFKKLCDLAQKNNHEIEVLILPYSEKYRQFFKNEVEPFGEIKKFSENKFRILDFWNDQDFEAGDFGDINHLNEQGSRKLMKKINEIHGHI